MTMKLYGFWRSIAAFRVRTALRLKGLPFEEIPVNILTGAQFTTEFGAVSAGHAVPALDHNGVTLLQSLPIIEYLDEVYATPPLLPADTKDRAYARALALVTAADSHPLMVPRTRKYLGDVLGADTAATEAWARHWTTHGLSTYERLLTRRPPQPFAVGTAPGLADICIAGHMLGAMFFKADTSAYPVVTALGTRCFELPAFADSHPLRQPGAPTSV
jgi:maleylacetoacetate isomerase